ncbi:MAG: sigma-70 family RNA polymerase sigma factor [Verrucomicrobia bacterium]|nr:sigma-70 family RNA polymerase sigma factor [Verrucomicrobiota bacterium]MBI3869368.1 sigma-70 family RNA polymerase sigma factor [Verrucomicrobiota bacterium]
MKSEPTSPDVDPAPPAAPRQGKLSDPERWVDEHGDYLFKYAMTRVRDPARAEDLVQETFLAALKGGKSFEGRAAEKSWLIGILKNKVVDAYRKTSRESSFTDLEFYQDEERDRFVQEGLFKGSWDHDLGPQEWSAEAGGTLDSQEFWKAFHDCSSKLPKAISTAFLLRELDEMETPEICGVLGISENNLWVMLHRARMALRRCLEANWFTKTR